jgi:hypothetical protein
VTCSILPQEVTALIWEHSIGHEYAVTRFPLVCRAFYEITKTRSIFDFQDNKIYEPASEAIKKHYRVKIDSASALTKAADDGVKEKLFVFFLRHTPSLKYFLQTFEHLVPLNECPPSTNDQIISHLKCDDEKELIFLEWKLLNAMSALSSSKRIVNFLRRVLNLVLIQSERPPLCLSDEQEWRKYGVTVEYIKTIFEEL